MKILLIAYEFPPSPSPQSLRWAYLSGELAKRGHEVHVLTPDLGPELGLPNLALNDQVVTHRTFAGPMRGLVAWHRKRRAALQLDSSTSEANVAQGPSAASRRPRRTSWKVRVINALFRLSEWLWFPDIRGEWRLFAAIAVRRILRACAFDAVITSHEPATCLQLGLYAQRLSRAPWIADLGDPVLAPYTPRRWARRAMRLERATWLQADAITVTARSAAALLESRHGKGRRVEALTQGHRGRPVTAVAPVSDFLELAYVGSFYSFRRAEALFEAVVATPGVRLSIATVSLPASLRMIVERHPNQFRLMGFLDHSEALELQEHAHVLVNIANRDAAQVPGKLYEYFGAARPILHLTHGGEDPGAALLTSLDRGWVVQDETLAISSLLARLRAGASTGEWLTGLDLCMQRVAPYSWSAIGTRLDQLLQDTVAGRAVLGPSRLLHARQRGELAE